MKFHIRFQGFLVFSLFCQCRQPKKRRFSRNRFRVLVSQSKRVVGMKINKRAGVFMYCYVVLFNTSYLTNSYIVFTLKIESLSKNTIFGLKMMVKIFLKFLHAGAQNHKFSNKNNNLHAWRNFKIIFSRPIFTIIFRPKIVFLVTYSILRVKPMYESVK